VKTNQETKPLTLGALIASGYRRYGKRRANAIIRLAAEAGLILLHKNGRFTIS
jgi:hypothetical protein